jgi:hypothetical protein
MPLDDRLSLAEADPGGPPGRLKELADVLELQVQAAAHVVAPRALGDQPQAVYRLYLEEGLWLSR